MGYQHIIVLTCVLYICNAQFDVTVDSGCNGLLCFHENGSYERGRIIQADTCEKFCVCDEFNVTLMSCPENLHFSISKGRCDYPDQAGCVPFSMTARNLQPAEGIFEMRHLPHSSNKELTMRQNGKAPKPKSLDDEKSTKHRSNSESQDESNSEETSRPITEPTTTTAEPRIRSSAERKQANLDANMKSIFPAQGAKNAPKPRKDGEVNAKDKEHNQNTASNIKVRSVGSFVETRVTPSSLVDTKVKPAGLMDGNVIKEDEVQYTEQLIMDRDTAQLVAMNDLDI